MGPVALLTLVVSAASGVVSADEPAIAEIYPRRTYVVDAIELNFWQREGRESFDQAIFWQFSWDKHDKRWHYIDRGWVLINEATLHHGECYAIEYRDLRIEAPVLFWSFTNFDAEVELRTDTNYVW